MDQSLCWQVRPQYQTCLHLLQTWFGVFSQFGLPQYLSLVVAEPDIFVIDKGALGKP